jgi:NTP pyrophosphatase (non-canonical NTP hydrolase)
MDLATIQKWLQAIDTKQLYPFQSSAECITAMVEELGEVATEVALLERIGTKAGWSKAASTERLTIELVQLFNTLIALANRYGIDLDRAYLEYMRQASDAEAS